MPTGLRLPTDAWDNEIEMTNSSLLGQLKPEYFWYCVSLSTEEGKSKKEADIRVMDRRDSHWVLLSWAGVLAALTERERG